MMLSAAHLLTLLVIITFSLPCHARTGDKGQKAFDNLDFKNANNYWYHQADKNNDVNAAWLYINSWYLNGIGRINNPEHNIDRLKNILAKANYTDKKAFSYHLKLAKNGVASSQYYVAAMYANQTGVALNFANAVKWYSKSAKQRYALAQYYLGLMLNLGRGIKKDENKAFILFLRSAQQGYSEAQEEAAFGYSMKQNTTLEFYWRKKAAENGSAGSQWLLANKYLKNKYRDFNKAIYWLNKAATQKYSYAQLELAELYEQGIIVKKDLSKAQSLYYGAAIQNNKNAQFKLAKLYLAQEDSIDNNTKAFKWFLKSAKQDHAKAQYYLASMYQNGVSIKQNKNKALHWYNKSANNNFSAAQFKIGKMLLRCNGKLNNKSKAIDWLSKAVEQGHIQAKKVLSLLKNKSLSCLKKQQHSPISISYNHTLISHKPNYNNNFGNSLRFSPDGYTLAVSEYSGDSAKIRGAGNVQLFTNNGDGWFWDGTLFSLSATAKGQFGISMSFSADGNSLAIGEYYAKLADIKKAGKVHIFSRDATKWRQSALLISATPATNNGFGQSISFSPDGKTLAIGEPYGDLPNTKNAGTVQLFSKTNKAWQYIDTLTSATPALNNGFGWDIKFNTSGTTLAIAELYNNNNKNSNTPIVQLFNQSNGNWSRGQGLKSLTPSSSYLFGRTISFSPDGKTLAVGEQFRDADKSNIVTKVLMFRKSNTQWNQEKALVVTNSKQYNHIYSINFSYDGNILAVGEQQYVEKYKTYQGKVQLFNQQGTDWIAGISIKANVTTQNNYFGSVLSFSPDGKQFAIGDQYGDFSNGMRKHGLVNIYDITKIP